MPDNPFKDDPVTEKTKKARMLAYYSLLVKGYSEAEALKAARQILNVT